MRTGLYRLWAVGVSIGILAIIVGCEQKAAEKQVPPPVAVFLPYVGPPSAPTPAPEETPEQENVASMPQAAPAIISSNTVEGAAVPPTAQLSGALRELVKMHQSGVSEDVILSYVTNSSTTFGLGSDQIIYLHDLGMSSVVTTALIQHDSAQAAARQKAVGNAVPVVAAAPFATPSLPMAYEQTQPVTTVAPTVVSTAAPMQAPESVNYFYSYLSPYGTWVQVDGYGMCWQPSVVVSNPEWRPYGDEGYWLWTDNGWYWYSYYSWGWAPFHYGRWCHRPQMGWFWVPDTHWGPAWVSWRQSGDYCGWAPLPPEVVFVPGAGLHYHGSAFAVGFDFGLTDFHYTFISVSHFCERRPHRYYLPPARRGPCFRESIVVNHYALDSHREIVNHGVGFEKIHRATPGLVQKATFRDAPLGTPSGPRPERLELRTSGAVVQRPVLPKTPPPAPKITPARAFPAAVARTAPKDPPARPPVRPAGPQPLTETRPGAITPTRPAPTASVAPQPTVSTPTTPTITTPPARPPTTRPAGPKPSTTPSFTTPMPSPRAQTPSAPAIPQNNLAPTPSRPPVVSTPAPAAPAPPRAASTLPSATRPPTQMPSATPSLPRPVTGPSPSVTTRPATPSYTPSPAPITRPATPSPSVTTRSITPAYTPPPQAPSATMRPATPSYTPPPRATPPAYSAPPPRAASPPPAASYSAPPRSQPSGPPAPSGSSGPGSKDKKN